MEKINFKNGQAPYINEKTLNQLQQNIQNAFDGGEGVSGDTLPIGAVIELPSDIVPENWLLCDGQAVSRTDYAELFAVLGTSHGEGDGSTTFNLPNMCGRTPVGKDSFDTDFDTLGKILGEKTQELRALIGASNNNTGNIGYRGVPPVPGYGNTISINGTVTSVENTNHSTLVVQANGEEPSTIQPSIIVNFIIKAKQSAGLVATVVNSLESDSKTDALAAEQGKVLNEKIEKLNTYSTEEINTGKKWIDGKDIYRKVVGVPNFSVSNTDVSTGVTNMSEVITIEGSLYRSGYTRRYPINNIYMNEWYVDLSTGIIEISTNNEYVTFRGYIVLEYTKTE